MTQQHTDAISAVWFLYSESSEPLGRLYRREGDAVPVVGARITDGDRWGSAEIVEIAELGPVCAMRRFRVVIRVTA